MPYGRRSQTYQLSTDVVQTLAQVVGLSVPLEDLAPLAEMLGDQLASIVVLDQLDLTDVQPVLDFDPRWSDEGAGE